MKKQKIQIELHDGDEILDKEIKSFGSSSGHIIVQGKHIGKKAKVIITKKEKVE